MRNAFVAAAVLLSMVCAPRPAAAWGFAGHRLIMERAIELLPPALKPVFEKYKAEIVVRVVDPDTWRTAGWEDDPNHFVDFGIPEYGAYPFDALPHDLNVAIEKFGRALVERNGLLPWREMEMYGNLRRNFEEFKRTTPYALSNLILLAPITAHYAQDANQPFHATNNYDGQMTGQAGLHSRFERDLIERYASRLQLAPKPPQKIGDVREYMFETLKASYQLVDPILEADKEAIAGKDAYDDAYFEAFFAKVKPILEERLSAAITATATVIVSAWEEAGRPTLRLNDARPVERVRPPR